MANKQRTAAKKKTRAHSSLLTKLVILVLLAAIGWQLYGLKSQVESAQAEKEQYAAQVAALQQENDALAADIAEGDTTEKMEEIAREELGLVTPGEYVFYDTSN